ncbi:50S ribosomal protein L9 [Sodalis-like secondary symbiont of Drepanosiphum platanoidis]|uniref:50S ribosomal protein L9 n=1 Tax=Sodalis-like secondary symbiont of Drepanosiphum platanoidis TaxID=2994493 RepID=UPI003464E4A8
MNVFLIKKILNLGNIGDKINVKNGYARNFLIPKEKAILVTKENIEYFKKKQLQEKLKIKKIKKIAQIKADKINKLSNIIIYAKSGEKGKIFGSIGYKEILKEIKLMGINLIKKEIKLPNGPLKNIGDYKIYIKLYNKIYANVIVKILKK